MIICGVSTYCFGSESRLLSFRTYRYEPRLRWFVLTVFERSRNVIAHISCFVRPRIRHLQPLFTEYRVRSTAFGKECLQSIDCGAFGYGHTTLSSETIVLGDTAVDEGYLLY
jgi:hypothetical protein